MIRALWLLAVVMTATGVVADTVQPAHVSGWLR